MKNLKRILSLALASVMVMGMMVVGASAAFVDQDQIDHTTAVNTLVALGVISGKEGNKFDPNGLLTRAEMATIVSVIRNRGVAPKFGTKTTPTYSDIKGHWAESYIEYCTSFGIVGGVGGGKYDPEGSLTATQAARMLLNAMGYGIEDPSNWALLTEVQARDEDVDLYYGIDDEIADPTNAKITRQQMAQMTYNALYANMADGNTYETIGTTKKPAYKLSINTTGAGAITGADAAAKAANVEKLEGMDFTSAADAQAVATSYGLTNNTHYTIGLLDVDVETTVEAVETLGHKYLSMNVKTGTLTAVVYDATNRVYTTTISGTDYPAGEDYSALMGQNVRVVTNTKNGSVYGVMANRGSVLFTGTIGDLPATSTDTAIKVNGKEYKIDAKLASGAAMTSANVGLYAYNVATSSGNLDSNSVKPECTMKGIDTNGDGKLDRIEYLPVEAVKITNVTSKAIVTSPVISGGTASLSTEADTLAVKVYEGIAKNDVAMAIPAANTVSGKIELAKTETVTGDVTGVNSATASTVLVNGQWYKKAGNALTTSAPALGAKEQTLTLVNGYYVAFAGPSAATTKDLVVVTAVAESNTTSGFDSYKAVKVMDLATGEVKEIKGETDFAGTVSKLGYLTDTDKDGLSEFVTVSASEKAGFDGYETAAADYDNGLTTINGKRIADDAKVVVVYNNKSAEAGNKVDATDGSQWTTLTATNMKLSASAMVDGKTLKGWKVDVGAATQTLTKTVNGIAYAQVVVVAFDGKSLPGAAGTTGFGYVVGEAPYKITENRTEYLTYTIWNGEENVTVKDTVTTDLAVGAIIEFKDKGDGIITREATTFTSGYVTGYSNVDGIVSISGSVTQNITEDTVILYVDHANKEGVAGGEIVLATEDETDPGKYTKNIWYTGSAGDAKLLVVEVNNDTLEAAVDTRVTLTINKDLASDNSNFEVTSFTYNGVTTEVKGAADNIAQKVKVGATLTLNMKATAAATKSITVSDGSNTIGTKTSATYTEGQTFTITCTVQAGGTLAITEG